MTSAHVTGTAPGRGDWTPDRLELYQWLDARAPSVAPVYAGAVAIVDDDEVPGRDLLIWHAIREMRNGLPVALAGGGRKARWDPTSQIKAVANVWRRERLPINEGGVVLEAADPDSSGSDRVYRVSSELVDLISQLIADSEAVGTSLTEANREALSSVLGRDVPVYVAHAWSKAFEQAPKFAHISDRPHQLDVTENAVREFASFENTLMTITRKSFENMDELDDILRRANGS